MRVMGSAWIAMRGERMFLVLNNSFGLLQLNLRAPATYVLYGISFPIFKKKREKITKIPPQQKPYI
jgi:hypothetical protein